MTAVSVSVDGRDDPELFREKIKTAVGSCCARVWIANHLFQRDPIALAGHVLSAHPSMDVGLMALNPLTMHPVQIAMAAATLDEFHPGRVTLSIGSGAPADLESVGIDSNRAFKQVRECVFIIRALLAGEKVLYEGSAFKVRSRRLVNGGSPIPIVLAASGEKMLDLAGREADGVLISAGASIEFVRWCLDHVAGGANGRRVRRIGLVYGSVHSNASLAHDLLRRTLANTLRGKHHARNLALADTRLDQEALRTSVAAEDWKQATALVTDAVVQRHAASGTSNQIVDRISAYRESGLDEVVISGAVDVQQLADLLKAASPSVV